jgi:NDP-sugar pyrophosphorylase family protein
MRAIILAGGQGTRLRPYTTLIPKPLVPLGGKYAILEVVLHQLKAAGFTHVTIAVNHLAHLIMAYFGDGSRFGMAVDYSIEDKPLSTIGPLTLISDLPENFLVMNGDILCDLNYGEFYKNHCEAGVTTSVSVFSRDVKIDFGVLQFDENLLLNKFVEKPTYSFDVSMGIYCLNRSVIENLPKGEPYGFDNLMIDGLAKGTGIRIAPFEGYWLDIGRPDDYEHADSNFQELSQRLNISLP